MMTVRRLALAAAVLLAVAVGSVACEPTVTVKECDWRGSVKATMRYRPLPLAPRVTGAEVRNHSMWRSSGWAPLCQGISVYDMREGYDDGFWNRCYSNAAVQGTTNPYCYSTTVNEGSGAYGFRGLRGYFDAWDDAYWFQDANILHQVGRSRPVMGCYFAAVFRPDDAEVSCPWVVVVPGRGIEHGG